MKKSGIVKYTSRRALEKNNTKVERR